MSNKSIAYQLGIYTLSAVAVVIAVIVFLNYDFSKKIITERIKQNVIHESGMITSQIARKVLTGKEVTRNVASQANYYASHNDLEYFLKKVLRFNPLISGFSVTITRNRKGHVFSVIRGTGKNDPVVLEKAFFQSEDTAGLKKKIDETHDGIWSEPFYCPTDSSLVVSYTYEIKDPEDTSAKGYISGLIGLDFLNQAVATINQREHNYAFIITHDGFFLTNPNHRWIMKKSIYDISDQIFSTHPQNKKMLHSGQASSGIVYPKLNNYEQSWFHFSPIPNTDWDIIILIPTRELFHDLDLILKKTIIVSILGMLSILLIIFFIYRRTLLPLSNVVESIRLFSDGEKRKTNRKNEIDLLNDSLFHLQQQYSGYKKEQEQSQKYRRKYEKDLKSARDIQAAIAPHDKSPFSRHPAFDLYASIHPAESIGGDLYNYFFIDPTHLLFAIGDVSGKGIPAALFMAVASTMIKNKATKLSANDIVSELNIELSHHNPNQHFLTLFLGILDTENGTLNYCNAAHNYPFIIKANRGIYILDQANGLPLGIYGNKDYTGSSCILKKGDIIVLYTDGVIDCKDLDDHFYGINRLKENISNLYELSVEEVVNRLLKSLEVFRGEAPQSDDISIMALQYRGGSR